MKRMNDKVKKKLYVMGPGDELKLTVWNHPKLNGRNSTSSIDMTNNIIINNNGEIHYPYIGWFHVAGMYLKQAQIALSNKLNKYIKNPQRNRKPTYSFQT